MPLQKRRCTSGREKLTNYLDDELLSKITEKLVIQIQLILTHGDPKTVDSCTSKDLIISGNSDRNTVVKSALVPSIRAVYLRINPRSWNEFVSLRFDVSGCYNIREKYIASEHYEKTQMLVPVDLEQYPVLNGNTRSLLECGKMCHQKESCRAFTFDKNQTICRDVTVGFTAQYSANSALKQFYVNKGIFTSLGFREFPNRLALYKINEQSLDQVGAADLCGQYYSQLIKVTSQPQMSSLQNIITGNDILLQANNQLFVSGMYASPDWKYSDGGEVMDNTLWAPDHPDPSHGHCVMLTLTGLASVDCSESLFSICG
ncbi:uncharacterized protein LOC117339003 [Pecten maximus]|uniref:uncharacterized protein LOC117339003 n=1 Tax=Pecten maximus TaxID=6579 RepID=UPI0014586772|nr:uncharacterized protein LOC117339003 [Pecten maximus]